MSVRNLLDLSGKTAIVTGGSRGIGLQMATALGEMGARVALTARRQDELDEARTGLESAGVECLTIAGDLADDGAIARIVDAALAAWGHIDILVNNAGCNWAAPAEEYPDEGWRKVMRLNVDAQFFLCREVGKRSMLPRRSGKIVNIASIAGLYGNPPAWGMQTTAYNTSKGALVNMTRALAAEWGRHNINVNAICPGFFPSKMTRVTLDRIDTEVLALTPLGRLGGDEDLKGAVVFLASEASRHVTGQVLAVDGGCTAV
ncbi:MAG: SDR family oxidoreductase [Betaproteobacteria bacterium]|jgi:NAD(P)-dependent dehydrogenase (short-subunit alcohol dehydrogenase family)|nr:SDR family oxidoreductase [Betaproteobacteria bacterium]